MRCYRSDRTLGRLAEVQTRALLPGLTVALLFAAWWLSLLVIVDTPIVNLTPPKIMVFGVLPLLLVARFWRLISQTDRSVILLTAAYLGWQPLAALLRGSAHDLKLTAGYAVFFGGAGLLAYTAARARPQAAAVALIVALVAGLVVTLVGVVLERATYPGITGVDPLRPLWEFVRPQGELADPVPGLGPQPLHFASGDPSVPRVASWFAHANYLAFFGFLAAGLLATLLLAADRRRAILAGIGLAGAALTTVWTYSRAGLLGLLVIVAAVAVVDRTTTPGRWRFRGLAWRATPLAIVVLTLAVSLVADEVGLRRFSAVVTDSEPAPTAEQEPSIEVSAARSGSLRIALQGAALGLITDDPLSVVIGPGPAAFDVAVHDPSSRYYVEESAGIVDPNSLWLTIGLSGGLVAVTVLAAILLVVWIRLLVVARRTDPGPRLWTVRWLAAWIPTWAVVQFVGTNPFNPSEAMILGTLLGAAVAQSGMAQEASNGATKIEEGPP